MFKCLFNEIQELTTQEAGLHVAFFQLGKDFYFDVYVVDIILEHLE